jgi:hypothetical protein
VQEPDRKISLGFIKNPAIERRLLKVQPLIHDLDFGKIQQVSKSAQAAEAG